MRRIASALQVFLEHVDMFDNNAFGLSETESVLIDPQQRLLLETVFDIATQRSVEMSEEQNRTNWGVFVGVSSSDYAKISAKHLKGVTAYSATGTAMSVVSGRVSYSFRLRGPAATVDTACSSSLVSMHMAYSSVTSDQSLYAFNSGVNLTLSPETPAMFQRAGMTTLNGRCKTLDASADGYVRGEAVVTCLISSDHEESIGLIKGTAVNQAGRSATLTAPNGPSQQEVLRNALHSASEKPSSMSSIQMHGTGTPLGDPIEIGAISAVLLMECEERIPSLCLLPNLGWAMESLLLE